MKKKDFSEAKKLFENHRHDEAFKMLAVEMGIKNIVFDRLHVALNSSKRIDIFPNSCSSGFIVILDQETALFFYREGDHFKYDGFEMGKYEKGDASIFDK